jgi:Flp pilus assembly protein TadG
MFAPSPGRRRIRAGAHTRASGQSVVEFGLVALMFALLLMGTVDFAILLNGWLGVSSSARDIARQLAVGVCPPTSTTSYVPGVPNVAGNKAKCASGGAGLAAGSIPNAAPPSGIQGVDTFGPYAVAATSTNTLIKASPPNPPTTWTTNQFAGGTITFTSGLNAGASREISSSTAYPPSPGTITVSSGFVSAPASGDTFTVSLVSVTVSVCTTDISSCYTNTSPNNVLNYYPGGNCWYDNTAAAPCVTPIHPTANDSIVVTVVARVQVVTPLVRPFFGCINGNNPRCDVAITSRAVARYEGPYI